DSDRAAVVSESFVRAYMNDGDPIGRTFTIEEGPGEPTTLYRVIGVARDSKYVDLREDFRPVAFLRTYRREESGSFIPAETLLIWSSAPLATLLASVKAAVAEIDPGIIGYFQSMTAEVDEALMRERLMASLSGFFGALAALLATIGLYGVMAYTVARRRNEIGIRMAL